MSAPTLINGQSAKEAIRELLDEYAERIDAERYEDWLELFTEDSVYQVIPRENVEQNLPASLIYCNSKNVLRDRIVSLLNANEYNPHYDRHMISGVRIVEQDEGLWQVSANYAVFQTSHEGQSRLFSVGRYADKIVRQNDRLLFREKRVIVDNFSVPSMLATPL
ncbi:MAG TPA: aromatic-ring-hydroxylating dioxygenase subunit beta [Burkholderiales bacterium]|nr:aromatic-ring-hydroxylating dioxygenase subunit beta [Burkholderiales bacterium]